MTLREEFESAYVTISRNADFRCAPFTDEYRDETTQAAYKLFKAAWQASRAAIVVQLPREMVGDCYEMDSVKSALTAAGVAYK